MYTNVYILINNIYVINGECKLVNTAQVIRILSIVAKSVSCGLFRRLMGKVDFNNYFLVSKQLAQHGSSLLRVS